MSTITSYYMAKSVFGHDLLRTKISKANAHFATVNLCLEKWFKESYKMSVNLENLNVDFVLQH